MKKKNGVLILVLSASVLLSPARVSAEPSEWTEQTSYSERALHKLGFGLNNFEKGWSEIYIHMMNAKQSGENTFTEVMRGTCYAIADTLGGAFHAFTFFLPIDLPLPEGGVHGSS